jgi:hypothetical protein
MLRTYHKPRGLIYLLPRIILSLRSWNQAYLEAPILLKTRTKTSIRYAKENDREKRERRKERESNVKGEI